MITARNASKQVFLPVVRELVRAYQAFAAYDALGYKGSDLTAPQADVIFTLGNTDGMSFKEIGEMTLITKGTLTGIVDRLEAKGLVRRNTDPNDGRSTRVNLTAKGEQLFESAFPRQIEYLKKRFDPLSKKQMKEIHQALVMLRQLFP